MLKHRGIVILFCILLLLLSFLQQFMSVSPWLYVLLILIFIFVEAYGSSVISSNFHLSAINAGSAKKKQVYLTFDDGPHEQTPALLALLAAEDVKAAFFLIGRNISKAPELVKEMHSCGHLLGNHSYTHSFWYHLQRKNALLRDLLRCNQEIRTITGAEPKIFRPPYGVTTPALGRALRSLPLITVGWSLRSFDTRKQNPGDLLNRLKKGTKPGAIVLLHDHSEALLTVLPQYLSYLRTQGYTTGDLNEILPGV